ncbi:DUF1566 domain-containing protein [Ideonella sp. YS5]|uniref:Lcl C-terminal domain-containing protein n=1 Tax=Ideonella sp. YS5 TaxID=3453714 RepID=UPI003EE837FB
MPPVDRCLSVSLLLAAVPALALAAGAETTAGRQPRLDDTGLTQCVVYDEQRGYIFTPDCQGTGQDGEFGRDAIASHDGNGRAGFSFEKIGADGEVLPHSATAWSCVRDKVTGAMWEVKTDDGGPRDGRARFKNRGNGLPGDASYYVQSINATGLCGASDWRLPTRVEMESLVDFSVGEGGPMIDGRWFPNSAAALHWTASSAKVNGGSSAYRWAVNFYNGQTIWHGGQYGEFAVRLVREGRTPPAHRWVANGGEVLDKSTHLVWRRCAEGQAWNGSTCDGAPATFLTVGEAVEHAKAQALSSGKAWRTPNIKELSSLADTDVRLPAVDRGAFPGFQIGAFHTGTHWTGNPVYSWRVSFDEGVVEVDFWGGKLLLVRNE